MLTYDELKELRDKLEYGEIDLKIAKELYWCNLKKRSPSWHSKDWKERRYGLIKDRCQVCCSMEILTLQHLSHPRKYSDYLSDLNKAYSKEFINENPEIDKYVLSNYIQNKYNYVPISHCPNCKSRKPNDRIRKSPRYLCSKCRYEFDDAFHITAEEVISKFFENNKAIEVRDKCFVSKDNWSNKHNLSNILYWIQRENTFNKYSETIEKEAFLLYLNDNIKYLSFEDTITACKKCASYFDLYNLELCPLCKEHYKGVQYSTCIQCLPQEKRKLALEKIEFGKQFNAMEKNLGID